MPPKSIGTDNVWSGPLLDRIDLHVEVAAIEYQDLANTELAETSDAILDRILVARKIQLSRAKQPSVPSGTNIPCNARLSSKQIRAFSANWTPRAHDSCNRLWKKFQLRVHVPTIGFF